MSSDILISWIEPFMLVLTRLGSLFAFLSVIGFEPAPRRFRVVLAILLTTGMVATLSSYVQPDSLVLALFFEALLGATMGLVARVIMSAVEVAGELISLQIGFGFNKTIDPLTRSESGPITRILSMVMAVMFFVTGAYQSVLKTLALSFQTVPPGASEYRPDFQSIVVETGTVMMVAGARIALPLVLVGVLVQASFGLMTKVAPQMNVWGLGFTFTIAFGFVAMVVFTPTFVSQTAALIEQIVDDVAEIGMVR